MLFQVEDSEGNDFDVPYSHYLKQILIPVSQQILFVIKLKALLLNHSLSINDINNYFA